MNSNHNGEVRSETDRYITESGQGPAERLAFGRGYTSIIRIAIFVVLFIAIGGTIFYLAGSSNG
ncbi:hypothetical protein [Devosia sp. Naph2]|uniref:hypothetical protein n=1 Tax=Devosia polycyclovorans TaxID=3345148 RepID=UPI0035D07D0E